MKSKYVAVRKLIERGWCKGTMARTKGGREVSFTSRRAAKFCIYGALCKAKVDVEKFKEDAGLRFPIGPWNDSTTKAKVLKAVDAAIQAVEMRSKRHR